MRIKMLAQIPYEVFYSPNYPGSTLDRIMPKEKCAIWDENGNDILAVRYVRDDPETFMTEKPYIKSVVGTDTDNLEELAEIIESQYDHEVDIELQSVTAVMAELDEFAMKESVPCLEFRVSELDPSDPTEYRFSLYVNGNKFGNEAKAGYIRNVIRYIKKGFEMSAGEVSLKNGHTLTARASDGDYPQVEVALDGDFARKIILATEVHDEKEGSVIKTYFYDGPDEVVDTYVQKLDDTMKGTAAQNVKKSGSLRNITADPEFRGQLVDTVEDFLHESGVKSLPSSEKEKELAGDTDENLAIIYGADYDRLADALASTVENWFFNEPSDDYLKWDDLKKSSPLIAGDFIPSTLVTDKLYFIDVRDEGDVRIVNAVLDDWDSNGGRMTKDYIGKTVIIVLGYDDDGERREFSEFYGTIDECVRNFKKDLENAATS